MMKRSFYVAYFITLVVYLLALSPAFAVTDKTISWQYGFYGYTGVLGEGGSYIDVAEVQAQHSASYSQIGLAQDYDPGYWEDFWTLHLRSESEVNISQGIATASSQTPASVDVLMAFGNVSLDLNESVEALSWTSTQCVYSPDSSETVTIEFNASGFDSGFNLPPDLMGSVTIYFGIWENVIDPGNFMLNEKEGWSFAELDYMGQPYSLLHQTSTPSSAGTNPAWSIDLETGQAYTFFTYMTAETVPEPTTLLLLGMGAFLMRRRNK